MFRARSASSGGQDEAQAGDGARRPSTEGATRLAADGGPEKPGRGPATGARGPSRQGRASEDPAHEPHPLHVKPPAHSRV